MATIPDRVKFLEAEERRLIKAMVELRKAWKASWEAPQQATYERARAALLQRRNAAQSELEALEHAELSLQAPLRTTYVHSRCSKGTTTTPRMGRRLADFPRSVLILKCAPCNDWFPTREFTWRDGGAKVSVPQINGVKKVAAHA